MEEFYRIRRLPPYVFEQVNRAKAAARNAGADIIDMGMGNPDLPTPPHVIEKLKETLGKPRTDRYSASKGITGLRRAQAAYYERRFGVKLNPKPRLSRPSAPRRVRERRAGDHVPGDVVLVPTELSDPRFRLPDGWRCRAVCAEPTPNCSARSKRRSSIRSPSRSP
jgi:alanine-synthesizing transaminase